jgi:Uma2 family endonuclease
MDKMPAEVTEKLFTVEEYHRMGQAGIFHEDDRVELIDGKIYRMSPIGHPHAVRVNRANAFFIESLGRTAVVSIQNPVQLSDWTEPQPDVVVFKPRADFYAARKPTPDDVLLIVEIADTSLSYDTKIKLPRFAAAGIPEVWIEDLQKETLLVYRNPARDAYAITMTLRSGDSISPFAFPGVTFKIADLFG